MGDSLLWKAALITLLASFACTGPEMAAAEASGPVLKHTAVFTEPPKQVENCRKMVDGPLLGNGDLGVVLGGPAESQGFFIAKNDFWQLAPAHATSVGTLRLSVPALKGAR